MKCRSGGASWKRFTRHNCTELAREGRDIRANCPVLVSGGILHRIELSCENGEGAGGDEPTAGNSYADCGEINEIEGKPYDPEI